jgi:nucleoside-diphosphate-sugar epimerase
MRPPHILGAGSHLGTGSPQGRDPMLLDRLRQGAPVVLLDGGALLIQPVSATDVARAALAALAAGRSAGRVYNVAGPDAVTTLGYYELVAAQIGAPLHVLSLPARLWVAAQPERAPFAQHRLYCTSCLTEETGYAPSVSLAAMIRETISGLEQSGAAQPYVPDAREAAMIERLRAAEADLMHLLTAPA